MVREEDCIRIGSVSKAHGLRGAVVVVADSNLIERYADKPVFLLLEGTPVPFFIAEGGLATRNHVSYIVKFDYVDTLAGAERLVGCDVFLEKKVLFEEGGEEEYDVFELNGFVVKDELSGEEGEVVDVLDNAGNVMLVVSIFGKEVLLPFSEVYILEVDWEEGKIAASIPAELVDLNG